MALIDTYNFNPLSFTDVSEELHSDLGSDDYQLGIAARGFKGGADFVVKNVGYQEISNTGNLGAFTGSTVAGIATQSDWELDTTIDSTLYQLDDIDIDITDDWDTVCAAIQTSVRTATGGTETVEIINGKIRVTSKDSYGSGSSVLIEAGSAGTGSGDLIAAITALSADYTATIDTAVDGATLVEDTDYELSVIDQKLTTATKLYTTQFTVYTRVKILDADYQDTDLYISYKIVNSNVDAAYFNYLNSKIDDAYSIANSYVYAPLNRDANLVIMNNSSNPTYQIDVSFDRLFAGSTAVTSFSDTIDITTDLDTGGEANSTMYYIHIMVGSGQPDIAMFSTSHDSPVLPANYTDSRMISFVYNTSGGDFWTFKQKNKRYNVDSIELFSVTLSGTTYYDVDLTTKAGIPNLNTIDELNCEVELRHNSSPPDIVYIYDYDGSSRLESGNLYDRDATGGIYFQYIHYVNSDQISINSGAGSDTNIDINVVGFKLNI